MKKLLLTSVALLFFSIGWAQSAAQLDAWAKEATTNSFPMLYELLSIPNDAMRPAEIALNVQWCERSFKERGFATKRIATPKAPLLLAEKKHPGAKQTVLIYLQIDGQPVDPSRWLQESPYKPTLKRPTAEGEWEAIAWEKIKAYEDDWRVFARSASDAKGPVVMFLNAMDVLIRKNITPNYNIKVIMDSEEELG